MQEKKRSKNGGGKKSAQKDVKVVERSVSAEALRGVAAIFFIAIAGFLIIAEAGGGGAVGSSLFRWLSWLLGVGYLLLPLSLILLAVLVFRSLEERFGWVQILGLAVFLLSALGLVNLAFPGRGGVIGASVSNPIASAVATPTTVIFLTAFMVAALVIAFDANLPELFKRIRGWFSFTRDEESKTEMDDVPVTGIHQEEMVDVEEMPAELAEEVPVPGERALAVSSFQDKADPAEAGFPIIAATGSEYEPPPVALLSKNKGKPEVGDVKANMNIIRRTLQNFGIQVEMDEASIGPTVTRYSMKPAEGVRLSKILALQSNLELALAASPVRIEAPIPGKSLVGIEVPNIARTTLGLAPLMSDEQFTSSDKPLLVALGRSITGQAHFADLARMPHMLVAGATGAGKTCGKDTYVFSEKGVLTFEELCPLPLNTETDYAIRVVTRDGVETTSKNYNNGMCDFYNITTEEGLSIEVTAEHPLWVIRDGTGCWQNGGSIQVGEYVAISRGSKLFGSHTAIGFTPLPNKTNKSRDISIPKEITPDLGLFMGLLTADGGLTIKNRIVYTQADEHVLELYRSLLKKLFGITTPIIAKSGRSNTAKDIIVHSKQLKDFLGHLGLGAVGAQKKEIPASIRAAQPNVIRSFIQGLICNDGHVSKVGLEITLANKKLVRQLQIVLLNFGIVAGVHQKKVKRYAHNEYWRLTIYGAEFVQYAKEIGFLTDRERQRAQASISRARNTNRNIVPTLASALSRMALSYRTAFATLTNGGWAYAPSIPVPKYHFRSLPSYTSGVRNPSYKALDRILEFYDPLASSVDYQNIAKIKSDNFYWAKVVKVERTRGEGYDFEVPGSHSFVGNGFINHNSVAIHDFIVSLLYRCGPERLRFIMVDPKRVELTPYNSIPHLLTPVITDAKKAILAFKWLAKEMERRYGILEAEHVRDISSYHENIVVPALEKGVREGQQPPEAMPYIVVVVDELADIMQAYPRELEAGIVRLAQMSRAVGIHLILSTQRPSVKVITGLIKANIPARVALQVASGIDSRTILDTGGAEKLLGAGDMLFLSGEMSKPRRIQAPFLSESELKKVVSFIAKHAEGTLPSEIDFSESGKIGGGLETVFNSMADEEGDDELYGEAKKTVIEAGKASTSYLQRKLGVGYARAAKLIDMLEERGVVGPADGAKPRDVIGAGNADELVKAAEQSDEEQP